MLLGASIESFRIGCQAPEVQIQLLASWLQNTLRIQLHRDISLTNLQTELEYESNHRPEQFFSEPRAATDVRNRMILIITGFPPDANYDAASILEVVRRFDGNADYA
uniref:Uncharacterized protein n=1 Tax=Physcomitrium patens TaxID=3218 RepID=A0A2K1KEA3_PHYPA|nr:hypothetical protein PHYPA_008488 [Physcomitrium patens]